MARVAFTLRIDAQERAALEHLSRIERRPVNQLLNEAIKSFLHRRGPKERSLEASLERLRAYRKSGPAFRKAREAFIEAEASIDDPLKAEPLEGRLVNRRVQTTLGKAKPVGPAQSKIRELLSA